jgi:hypothetical protein
MTTCSLVDRCLGFGGIWRIQLQIGGSHHARHDTNSWSKVLHLRGYLRFIKFILFTLWNSVSLRLVLLLPSTTRFFNSLFTLGYSVKIPFSFVLPHVWYIHRQQRFWTFRPSKMRTLCYFERLRNNYPVTQGHIPQKRIPQRPSASLENRANNWRRFALSGIERTLFNRRSALYWHDNRTVPGVAITLWTCIRDESGSDMSWVSIYPD